MVEPTPPIKVACLDFSGGSGTSSILAKKLVKDKNFLN
jgi:hypothetical protein